MLPRMPNQGAQGGPLQPCLELGLGEAFHPLVLSVPDKQMMLPLFSPTSSRTAAKITLWTCWAQTSGPPTPLIPSGKLRFCVVCGSGWDLSLLVLMPHRVFGG